MLAVVFVVSRHHALLLGFRTGLNMVVVSSWSGVKKIIGIGVWQQNLVNYLHLIFSLARAVLQI